MGGNLAKQTQENIINNTVKNSTEIFQQVSNENKQNIIVNQKIKVNVTGKLTCSGKLELTNDSSVTVKGLSDIKADQFADIDFKVQEEFAIASIAELEQANDGFSIFPQLNISDIVQKAITNNVTENTAAINQEIKNTIEQKVSVDQAIEFTVGDTGEVNVSGPCIFTNDATVDLLAKNSTNALMNVMLKTDTGIMIQQELDALSKQKNKGVDLTLVIVIVVIVIVVGTAIGLGVKYGKKKK